MTFREVKKFKAFDALKDNLAKKRYVIDSYSKVIGVTPGYLASKFDKLRQLGFEYDTLVFDDASLMSNLDLLMAV